MAMLEPFIRANAEAADRSPCWPVTDRPSSSTRVAFPLPAYTVFRHIGFPDEDAETRQALVRQPQAVPVGPGPPRPNRWRIAENMVAYWRYCRAFTDAKLDDLADDFAYATSSGAHLEDPTQLTLRRGEERRSTACPSPGTRRHEPALQHRAPAAQPSRASGRRSAPTPTARDGRRRGGAALRLQPGVLAADHRSPSAIGGVEIPEGPRSSCCSRPPTATLAASTIRTPSDIHRANARSHISFGRGHPLLPGSGDGPHGGSWEAGRPGRAKHPCGWSRASPSRHLNVQFRGPEELWLAWDRPTDAGRLRRAPVRITLTFDNGPTPGVTDDVLDVLAGRDVPATFFVVGNRLREPAGRALAERAKAEGHRIGNHAHPHHPPRRVPTPLPCGTR